MGPSFLLRKFALSVLSVFLNSEEFLGGNIISELDMGKNNFIMENFQTIYM